MSTRHNLSGTLCKPFALVGIQTATLKFEARSTGCFLLSHATKLTEMSYVPSVSPRGHAPPVVADGRVARLCSDGARGASRG